MFARLFGGGNVNFGSEATKLLGTLDECAKTFKSIKNSTNLANATSKYKSASAKLNEVESRIKFLQSKFKSTIESKKAPRNSLPNSARNYISLNGNSFKVRRTPTIRTMGTIITNFNKSRGNYNAKKAAENKASANAAKTAAAQKAAENKARNNAAKAAAAQKAANDKARNDAAKAAAAQKASENKALSNAAQLQQIKTAAAGMGSSVNALKRQVNINQTIQSTLGTSTNLNLANLQRRVNQATLPDKTKKE
jgi:hypothetical protein